MTLEAMFKGWVGELQTRVAQGLFLDPSDYHTFNNVLIKMKECSTQIDHVVVSRYGIFVIETKRKGGWIYGAESDKQWTQVCYHKKYKFQNPLHQNYLHTQSLADCLGIDHDKIHSVVVFWGDCQFKTSMPEKVLNNHCTDYIKSKKNVILTDAEVERVCVELKRIKDTTSWLDGRRHVKSLKKRFDN